VWNQLNERLFDGRMSSPLISLANGERRLGSWSPRTRELRLSRTLVFEQSWGEVLEVLKHEMAHQFVTEVLRTRETPHGPIFREVCAARGIDGAATGRVVGEKVAPPRIVERVRRLLALAGSPEEHEARAATQAAQRLMLKYNLDRIEENEGYTSRQVGPIRQRFPVHEKALGGLLAKHFFVRSMLVNVWNVGTGRSGRVLELSGTTENVEMASWVHAYLTATSQRLWESHHRRTGANKGRSERRRYVTGVVMGFIEKLDEQADTNRREGLVWVGDPRLEQYVRGRYDRVRRGRAGRIQPTAAWHAGRAAGREIVLQRPLAERGTAVRGLLGG
jgi:hypothetical protein